MDLFEFRRDYIMGGLSRKHLNPNPIVQFEKWLDEMLRFNLTDPTAMLLATVNRQQQPSQRIVLLKKVNQQGFVFFSHTDSDKANDIDHNPNVCLHFPWNMVERQVKVIGTVEHISRPESEDYFKSRPRESQLAALSSPQSRPLESRQQLMDSYHANEKQYIEDVPMPDQWGGYRVVPQAIEFWQGGAHRLHDRFVYQRDTEGHWSIQRLAP